MMFWRKKKEAVPDVAAAETKDAAAATVPRAISSGHSMPQGKLSARLKPGKRQDAAMVEFVKGVWMQDGETTLKHLLLLEGARKRFKKHVSAQGGSPASVDLAARYLRAAEKSDQADREKAAEEALAAYAKVMKKEGTPIGKGFGTKAEERTTKTTQLWEQAEGDEGDTSSSWTVLEKEGKHAVGCLALEAFPSFVKSPNCNKLLRDLRASKKGGRESALEGGLSKAGSTLPTSADEWLNTFVGIAESFPACIVISDMSIAGAPMVYVNNEFCKVTQYERHEVVGRNCRFLQGPDSEPESVHVIRSTLSRAKECHVLITNYRKDGTKFDNLLSMKPVLDSDGNYRFVIGVQFEVIKDRSLKRRMIQLDKLLRLLPSNLGLPSNEAAKKRGWLAARFDTRSNTKPAAAAGLQRGTWPEESTSGDGFEAVLALTRLLWCSADQAAVLKGLVMHPASREQLERFAARSAEGVASLLEYCVLAADLEEAMKPWSEMDDAAAMMAARDALKSALQKHPLFPPGGNPEEGMGSRVASSIKSLADLSVLQPFLASKYGAACVRDIWNREKAGQHIKAGTPTTAAAGQARIQVDPDRWLKAVMLAVEPLSIGVAVCDMSAPGLPLSGVSSGFTELTGYTQEEAVGRSCKFLQGNGTESYVVDEIIESLRLAKPSITKLHNYRKDGTKMQLMLALVPIFGPLGEYRWQVAFQMEFTDHPRTVPQQLAEMELALSLLPRCTDGSEVPGSPNLSGAAALIGDQLLSPRVPTPMAPCKEEEGFSSHFEAAVVALTRTLWLADAPSALGQLLLDGEGFAAFESYIKHHSSELCAVHLRFWREAFAIDAAEGEEAQAAAMKKMYRRMQYNALFYCTTTEIVIGELNHTFWPTVCQEMMRCQKQSLELLAGNPFSGFLASPAAAAYISALRVRELQGEKAPPRTAAFGSPSTDCVGVFVHMFSVITAGAPFASVLVDTEACIAASNAAFAEMMGPKAGTLIGQDVTVLLASSSNDSSSTGAAKEMLEAGTAMTSLKLWPNLHLCLRPVVTPAGHRLFTAITAVPAGASGAAMHRFLSLLPQTITGTPPACLPDFLSAHEAA